MAEQTGEIPSGIQRSEGVQKRIDEVRRLSQRSKKEGKEKQRETRLLRMELLLDNAKLMVTLFNTLEDNSAVTADEFKQKVIDSGLVVHPEATEKFIQNLLTSKEETGKIISDLQKAAEKSSHDYKDPKNLLNQFIGLGTYPFGQIVVDADFPLALIIFIENDDDFKRIDPRKNVGGFFTPYHSKWVETSPNNCQFEGCPLIVINGLPEAGTSQLIDHEESHSKHNRMLRAIPSERKAIVWPNHSYLALSSRVKRFTYEADLPNKVVPGTKDWQDIMDYALGRAKDEILAGYSEDHKIGKMVDYLLLKSDKEGGNYDYFSELGIPKDSPLYNELWLAYEKYFQKVKRRLPDYLRKIDGVIHMYEFLGLSVRKELFHWVLAQIPLQKWEEQLERSLFFEEADVLEEIDNFSVFYSDHGFAQEIREEFRQECQSNQEQPLFNVAEKARKKIEGYKRTLTFAWKELKRPRYKPMEIGKEIKPIS